MGVFNKTKPQPGNRRAVLMSIPQLREGVTVTPRADGSAMVIVRHPRGATLFDRFRPPILEKKHELDDLGAFVLDQIDSRRTVEEIIDRFTEHFRLSLRDAELSTVAFMKLLLTRRVIRVVEAETPAEAQSEA